MVACFLSAFAYSQENNKMEFATWDANRDGNIDDKEFMMTSRFFEKWDVNGDNKISPTEFQDELFRLVDVNHDFKITSDEWSKVNELIKTQKGSKPLDFGASDTDKNNFMDVDQFNSKVKGEFGKWDKDHNGYLNRTEFYTGVFMFWDQDKNGTISEDEFNKIKDIVKDNKELADQIFY